MTVATFAELSAWLVRRIESLDADCNDDETRASIGPDAVKRSQASVAAFRDVLFQITPAMLAEVGKARRVAAEYRPPLDDIPDEPRTAAGRDVVEATASDPFVPDDQRAALRDAARRTVLAIEAEAVPTRNDLAAALKQLHDGQKVWSYPVEGPVAEADWIVEWLTVHRRGPPLRHQRVDDAYAAAGFDAMDPTIARLMDGDR
ncbi:MAG: hypothetical protein LC798_21930 [Chloroflexi bacterium]|nr:hypothetical protein [Chloroflexota bacterium]